MAYFLLHSTFMTAPKGLEADPADLCDHIIDKLVEANDLVHAEHKLKVHLADFCGPGERIVNLFITNKTL